MRRKPKRLSFDDHRWNTGHGGPRRGAGRRARRPGIIHHVRRPKVPNSCPVHVTLRVREDVPSLRDRELVREFRRSLAKAALRGNFRVVHYSLQRNPLHLIVEAANRVALGAGMAAPLHRLNLRIRRIFPPFAPESPADRACASYQSLPGCGIHHGVLGPDPTSAPHIGR